MSAPTCLWCDDPVVTQDEYDQPLCMAHAKEWDDAKVTAEARPLRRFGDEEQ